MVSNIYVRVTVEPIVHVSIFSKLYKLENVKNFHRTLNFKFYMQSTNHEKRKTIDSNLKQTFKVLLGISKKKINLII